MKRSFAGSVKGKLEEAKIKKTPGVGASMDQPF
jgi:hypothetical protein